MLLRAEHSQRKSEWNTASQTKRVSLKLLGGNIQDIFHLCEKRAPGHSCTDFLFALHSHRVYNPAPRQVLTNRKTRTLEKWCQTTQQGEEWWKRIIYWSLQRTLKRQKLSGRKNTFEISREQRCCIHPLVCCLFTLISIWNRPVKRPHAINQINTSGRFWVVSSSYWNSLYT